MCLPGQSNVPGTGHGQSNVPGTVEFARNDTSFACPQPTKSHIICLYTTHQSVHNHQSTTKRS